MKWIFIVILLFVLAMVVLNKRAAAVFRILLRCGGGVITILICNQILLWQNLVSTIGINVLTILTCAILGFPGVVLLFAIEFLGQL